VTDELVSGSDLSAPDGFLVPRADADTMRWRDYVVASALHAGLILLAYVLSSRLNRIRAVAALGAFVVGLGCLRGFYLLRTLYPASAFGFLGTVSIGAGWFFRGRDASLS
jgi:hypothetical protein